MIRVDAVNNLLARITFIEYTPIVLPVDYLLVESNSKYIFFSKLTPNIVLIFLAH